MHSIARSLGAGTRRLAVGASGAAAGAAVAPGSHPASARAPVSIETASPPAAPSKFSDEYEIIDGNGDVIGSDRSIFPLEDVAAAAAEFRVALQAAHHTPPAAEPVAGPSTAHDVGAGPSCARGSSSGTSDGADADAFIEVSRTHADPTRRRPTQPQGVSHVDGMNRQTRVTLR